MKLPVYGNTGFYQVNPSSSSLTFVWSLNKWVIFLNSMAFPSDYGIGALGASN